MEHQETTEMTEMEGHGAATSGAFPPFDSTTFASQLLWLAVTFLILFFMVKRLALPRIGEILETRRDRIANDLGEASRLKQKSEEAKEAYTTELAAARETARAHARAEREKVVSRLESLRLGKEGEMNASMEKAAQKITKAKLASLDAVEEQSKDIASALFEKLTGKAPTKANVDKAYSGLSN